MPTPIVLPNLGESVTSAILLRWIKQDGQAVAKDEPVCEVETDKANAEINAPTAGVLRTTKKPGDNLTVGEVIGNVDEAGEPAASIPAAVTPAAAKLAPTLTPAPAATKPAEPTMPLEDLSPAVRVLVVENGLDAAALQKSAPGGRLTKEYILSYMADQQRAGAGNGTKPTEASPAAAAPVATTPVTIVEKVAPAAVPASKSASDQPVMDPNAAPKDFDANGERRVKMTKIRQMIAKRLVQAQQTAAILTTFNEVDLTEVMSLRSKYKETFEKAYGVGLGFMSFFARAVVMGLKEFPRLNAYMDGDEIIYHQHVNLGVAVSTERGLAVPVIRKVETMGFAKIESEIKRVAQAVRDNKLSVDELSGGTFSITNGGVFGSLLSTPILNPPQSGILGMHTIQKRPVVIGDKIEIRPMMYLAVSYDHRVVDGKESISFLVRVKQCLEDPARLMLEI